MHFKQGSLPLRPPLPLPHYRNHSSLEESPILTQSPSPSHSPHSPHYLYPESLERNRGGMGVTVGLKQRIVGLLERLRDWLQQLCLTDTCMHEVAEQLEPIIDEIKEAAEDEGDSCWFSLPLDHRHSRADSQKERNQSILIHEGSACGGQGWVVSEGEKGLLRVFFKKYCRLLENSLLRISKYAGEKKLRFLLDTNIRSIFTETLRISYDLKLIEARLREHRNIRFSNNKNAYLNLLATRVGMLLVERGGVAGAFAVLKEGWREEGRQDREVVEQMMARIGSLRRIYSRNALRQLQSYTYQWRQSAFRLKLEEQLFLVDTIRTRIYSMLAELVGLGESASDFRTQWQCAVENCLNGACGELFGEEDCFFMNLQDIMNERSAKREKLVTLADFLEEDSERVGSGRLFLAQLTIDELRTCILSGQIHKNEKSDHSLLLVPIKPASGIFFVRLESEAPSSAQLRPPMRLSSFRRLLRVVELITPVLEDLSAICRRVEACWEETERHEHYSLLLQEFLKADLSKEQGHMQRECRSSEIEIDSHRLESSVETAKDIMERCGINCLMVYHLGERGINDSPCILYGNSEIAASQRFIIDSIYEQLVSSGKDLLVINRNGQLFNILPLWEKSVRVGLVSYITASQKVDAGVVSQCLVPLLLKCDGKLECHHCQVSLKTPPAGPHLSQISEQSTGNPLIDFHTASKLVSCQNLVELEAECASVLRGRGNFFFRMVFKVDLSDSEVFYSLKGGMMELLELQDKHILIHQEMFMEDYTSLSHCSPFAKLAFDSPCFNNPQLYIYQNEQQFPLRLVAIPLKNSRHHFGYCLSAFYHSDEILSEQHTSFLQRMAECVSMNGWVFKATKLNDERLQNYYRQEEEKQGQKICKEILGGIKLPKEGKLTSSFLDLSISLKKCFSETNNSRYQCNIKVIKINLQSCKMSIISSTNAAEGETNIDEAIIQKLTHNNALYTHERLNSSECRLKKSDQNRTIKALSASNLNNIAIFWPELPERATSQLLEMVKERYELKGLFANEHLGFVQDLNRKLSKESSGNKQYVLLKINESLRPNVGYWVQFEHEVIEPKDKHIINQQVVSQCLTLYNRVAQQSIQHQSKAYNRKSLMEFAQIVSKKSAIRHSVLSFHQNYEVSKYRMAIFYEKLERCIPNVANNNFVHSRMLRTGFSMLKAYNNNKLIKSSISIDRFAPVIERMARQASNRWGLKAIYEFVEDNSQFSWYRSCNKLISIMQQRASEILKCSFSAITHMSRVRRGNRMADRCQSAQKMHLLISRIQRREVYQHFFSQMHKVHLDYINSFDLIAQEFITLAFNSRESFTLFANERFDAVLSHSCYGSVERVQIGVCQINQSSLVIYHLNSQRQFSGVVQQRPVSLQPQKNNNFIFLPVAVSSCNFLIYKVWLKQNCKEGREAVVIRNCISNGMLPCYQRYLQTQLQRTQKLADILLRITCKEMWNAAMDETQTIYAFGKSNNYEEQSDKVRAFTAIKHLKHCQLIRELKAVRTAINEQTKQYYRQEYEYNAISNAITSGLPNQLRTDDAEIFGRYDEFISKDKLREQRENTEKLELEYQKKNLHYQIKSKTFATSKILIYCDRKEKDIIEGTSLSLLMRESDQNWSRNGTQVQRAIVDGKMRLSKNAERHRDLERKKKGMSARSMGLLFTNIARANVDKSKKLAFMTMAWPMGGRIRA